LGEELDDMEFEEKEEKMSAEKPINTLN